MMGLTLIEIFAIIFIHWVADFICQDEKWALGKSKNWKYLLSHTLTYSAIWMVVGIFLTSPLWFGVLEVEKWYLFPLVTFIFHTVTDYFTSRIVSRKFANKEYGSSIPNFGGFTVIGLDQVLHYVQLFSTYYILKWCI